MGFSQKNIFNSFPNIFNCFSNISNSFQRQPGAGSAQKKEKNRPTITHPNQRN
jgi:hypothetical protein